MGKARIEMPTVSLTTTGTTTAIRMIAECDGPGEFAPLAWATMTDTFATTVRRGTRATGTASRRGARTRGITTDTTARVIAGSGRRVAATRTATAHVPNIRPDTARPLNPATGKAIACTSVDSGGVVDWCDAVRCRDVAEPRVNKHSEHSLHF
jgi:hypothetical protein